MKKTIASLLCILLWLCGCDTVPPDTTVGTIPTIAPTETQTSTVTTVPPATEPPVTEPPVTEPLVTDPPAPETAPATALADGVVFLLCTADMGTSLEIIGEEENYYIVKLEDGCGLIEKRLVRMAGEEAYDTWTGYSYYGAGFYTNYHLLSTGMTELGTNKKVEVLEDIGDVLMVRFGDTVGFMKQKSLSRSKISTSPSSGGNTDGGDIELSAGGGVVLLSHFIPNSRENEVIGTGCVKVDNAEIILGWFDYGETVNLVTEESQLPQKEGWSVAYLDGAWGYVRQNLIRQEGQPSPEPWDGYAKYKAAVYDNYYLAGTEIKTLSTNTVVRVLDDLGDSYLVSVGDTVGYMAKEKVSETKNAQGGNNGGSGGEWSDPVM